LAYKNLGKTLILSSACETGIGILGITTLAHALGVTEPLGLGTYPFIQKDVLESPLNFGGSSLSIIEKVCVKTPFLKKIAHG
jgi:hypothetical protein